MLLDAFLSISLLERLHDYRNDNDDEKHGGDLVHRAIGCTLQGVGPRHELLPAQTKPVVKPVMPMMPAAFVQGHSEDQSTTPGVATSRRPKSQLAIIAGFMMNRRSFISIV